MKLWITEIKAVKPGTAADIRSYAGPNVPGISHSDAQVYCDNNEMAHCHVVGELIAEIPCKAGSYAPDWAKQIDYEVAMNN